MMADRALRGLASIRPKSLAEAEGIPGIGPVKLHAVLLRLKRRRLEEWGNERHAAIDAIERARPSASHGRVTISAKTV